MNSMDTKRFFLVLCLGVAVASGCNKTTRVACDGSTPTWNGQVADIIISDCGGSDCHGSNGKSTDYMTYAGIKPDLLNGKFEKQVLETRFMPQNNELPDSSLAKLQCWLENGFPES